MGSRDGFQTLSPLGQEGEKHAGKCAFVAGTDPGGPNQKIERCGKTKQMKLAFPAGDPKILIRAEGGLNSPSGAEAVWRDSQTAKAKISDSVFMNIATGEKKAKPLCKVQGVGCQNTGLDREGVCPACGVNRPGGCFCKIACHEECQALPSANLKGETHHSRLLPHLKLTAEIKLQAIGLKFAGGPLRREWIPEVGDLYTPLTSSLNLYRVEEDLGEKYRVTDLQATFSQKGFHIISKGDFDADSRVHLPLHLVRELELQAALALYSRRGLGLRKDQMEDLFELLWV